ncbi:hypothetical protein WN59_09975 [Salinicoccus sediminis]|uniref:Uncharacterized protein n=1 Tax=Salinicoccus sediminis TaxID=1432562 RepID=A0A0M2SJT9_9STAP|nr:hypothetical protein [Salinicoccus sediminis]KKK33926.1 hypothetical protein WN59_09975 [Salinicoccus sediminis]
MLTVRYNHKLKKTEITATVISKSRIEWIQDVRKLMSDYISQSYVLKEIVNSIFNGYFISNKTKQKYYHEYYKLLKYRDLLLLYISDSKEHKEIVKLIECLHEKTMFNLSERNLSKEKKENYHKNQREAAEKLRVEARDYFKNLWEEAKIETELNKKFSNK